MSKIKSKNKNLTLKTVWLVYWDTHTKNEKEYLNNFGIHKKYIDLISGRKSFENITDYAETVYQLLSTSFYDKALFANYKNGLKNKIHFFKNTVPYFTPYHSDLYRELNNVSNNQGIDSLEYKELTKKWKNISPQIGIGHNPSLEITKVYDFVYYEDKENNEIMEWTQRVNNSKEKRIKSINGW